jgi:hypothetical protein
MTRRDRKYAVHPDELDPVLRLGLAGARILLVDGQTAFDYRTIYYDTAELASYLGCAQRRRRRFKLRTRQRGPGQPVWVEVKTRGPRGLTIKDQVAALTPAGPGDPPPEPDLSVWTSALDVLSTRRVTPPAADGLRACLEVRYRRTTFLLPGGQGRATVDTNLEWGRPETDLNSLTDLAIVETKTTGCASGLDRTAWSVGRRPAALSKFGVGMATTYSGLPAHRWQRLIRQYL